MILKNIAAKGGLFVSSQFLYSCNGVSIFKSDKLGEEKVKIDLVEDGLDEVNLEYSKEVIAFIKDNRVKSVYLPTLRVLIDKEFEDSIGAIAISPSAMNIAIGFTNGKAIIYNTLLGAALGKFSFFSDGSKIEHIGFLGDELIYSATQDKIVFIDLLKKGAVSKVASHDGIKSIYSNEDKVVYITNSNELYLIDLKNAKDPQRSILITLESDVVDMKFSRYGENIFIALKDRIFSVDIKSKKTTLIKDGYDLIVNISLDEDKMLFVGLENSSETVELLQESVVSTQEETISAQENSNFEATSTSVDNSVATTVKDENVIRFLTVDDSKTIRMVIKRSILNNFENVEVGEAIDGVDALKYLKANLDTDVVFLDWNMPRMDGDEVVEEISKIPELKNLKIIMATTEGGKDRVTQMISKGVIGYLVKPLRAESVNPLAQKMIEMVQKGRLKNV